MAEARTILEIGALSRFGGRLRHVKSRFPRIRASASRAIGTEIEDQSLFGIVARPSRQTHAIRVPGPGEVHPVALRHPRDLLILRRRWRRCWPKASGTQGAENEADLAAMRCSRPHPFAHGSLNVRETVEI